MSRVQIQMTVAICKGYQTFLLYSFVFLLDWKVLFVCISLTPLFSGSVQVHSSESDIDALCVGPRFATMGVS